MTQKATPGDAADEIYALIEVLHNAEQRLDELTQGEVDTVSNREGRTLLLRRAQESERHREAARFRQMADNIRDVFFLRSIDGTQMYYVSPAYERIWSRSCQSLYDEPGSWTESIHPDDLDEAVRALDAGRHIGADCEYRVIRPDGEIRWVQVRTFPIADEAGAIYRNAGVATDVTTRKEAERKIRRLNRVYAVLSGINSLIIRATNRTELFSESCRIAVDVGEFQMAWVGSTDRADNAATLAAWRGGDEDFRARIRRNLRAGIHNGDAIECRALRSEEPIFCNDVATDARLTQQREKFLDKGYRAAAFLPLTADGGRQVAVLALMSGETEVFDAEETDLLRGLAGDISFALEHLKQSEQLTYVAYYDLLTGLANQRLFLERVAQYVLSAGLHGNRLAVAVIDLERFKNINDTFGRPAADSLLQQITAWLKQNLGDANLLARVGPDRFAVVMPDISQIDNAARLLDRSINLFLEHPFQLNDSAFRLGVKVGIALFPDDGGSADELFANAEAALKKAKASGDRYLLYAQKMTETVTGRLLMEYRLRHALKNDEFVLHYQPKFSLSTGLLTGVEALIRWNDSHNGLVAPGQFIGILEETGLIVEVGRWALHQAIEDHLAWRAAGLPSVRIAVNVSPLQLRNDAFVDDVQLALGVDGRASGGLELEITESVIMKDVERTIGSLRRIRAMDVSIAIDDFGTGFSSLSYLSKLPVDTLKIDRSFITDMTAMPEGLALVSTIIALGKSLKLGVVAEGVETEEQARLLRSLHCDEAQGFYFSRPLPRGLLEEKFLKPAAVLAAQSTSDGKPSPLS